MKEVAAYLLAVLGGNTSPTIHDLKAILGSVGADDDDAMLELLLANVKGKDISELISSGKEKMASVLSGCGGLGSDNLGGVAEAKIPEKVEEKKEEKADEKDEESEDDCILNIFDD
ncbi:60S acidic ribosomal protein P2 [Heracleum sosnowskyi]|uniref:60S acidic ribosomal protein P2 n=1 Tax=Heracleum sosnowskyi TaxID=360622 RepID=A0AAD8GU90_9APIA|nr:60S acidic ribosomal protein P2 [Heracleum sosnowskyi]